MSEVKCKYCDEVDFWKKQINASDEMVCQLVIKNKRTEGALTTKPYDLNYCPICGRKLEEE